MAETFDQRLDRVEETMALLEHAIAELIAELIASGQRTLTKEDEAFLVEQGVEVPR